MPAAVSKNGAGLALAFFGSLTHTSGRRLRAVARPPVTSHIPGG
jgi:hypothetical protein